MSFLSRRHFVVSVDVQVKFFFSWAALGWRMVLELAVKQQ